MKASKSSKSNARALKTPIRKRKGQNMTRIVPNSNSIEVRQANQGEREADDTETESHLCAVV